MTHHQHQCALCGEVTLCEDVECFGVVAVACKKCSPFKHMLKLATRESKRWQDHYERRRAVDER